MKAIGWGDGQIWRENPRLKMCAILSSSLAWVCHRSNCTASRTAFCSVVDSNLVPLCASLGAERHAKELATHDRLSPISAMR
jgi:hypothetical protein